MKKERNSSFELLRIISMILIVIHHFSLYTDFNVRTEFSVSKITMEILQSGGKIGVDIFVLIGSYFLIGKKFKYRRPVYLLVETIFYFYAILILSIIFKLPVLDYTSIVSIIFPFPKEYWFVVHYFMLLVTTPILNIVINKINKYQYEIMLATVAIFWVIIPTFLNEKMGYSEYTLFISLYFGAGYLRLYPPNFIENQRLLIKLTSLSLILTILSIVSLNILGIKVDAALAHSTYFLEANRFLTITNSLGIFCLFRNISIHSKMINKIATTSFGVYLIHENVILRKVIWGAVTSIGKKLSIPLFLYGILASLTVYLLCVAVDLLKQVALGKILESVTEKISYNIKKIIDRHIFE